jgi:hypothetical protein
MRKLLRPSGRKAGISLEHELVLPESSDFRAKAYTVTLTDITELSEERLPFMNSFPEFERDRLAIKAKEPFVL